MIHRLTVKIDPKIEMNRYYSKYFGKKINFKQPKDLIEKIYWLQINSDTSLWTKCADKYAVRGYVEGHGLAQYLPKLYGKWDKPDEIDFATLPEQFVLKTNNGCLQVIIVKDKNKVDIESIRNSLKKWLKIPYGYSGAELHYTRIKPCIIVEELLNNDFRDSFSPHSMVDYKLWCFNGKPESCLVVYNRMPGNVSIALYDTQWKPIPENIKSNKFDTYHPEIDIPKPQCLEEMLNIAKALSKDFKEVRVDFYVVNNKPVIGELTFSTGFGYFTKEYYEYLGSKIDLSKVKRIK